MDDFAEIFFRGARYEQWMRFHFMRDVPGKDDAALISVPHEAAERSLREEPEFAMLLTALDGSEISLERTRDAIAAWACSRLGIAGGGKELAERMRRLAGDREFLRLMDMHNGWIQELANADVAQQSSNESLQAPSFSAWSSAFSRWLEDQGSPFPSGQDDMR